MTDRRRCAPASSTVHGWKMDDPANHSQSPGSQDAESRRLGERRARWKARLAERRAQPADPQADWLERFTALEALIAAAVREPSASSDDVEYWKAEAERLVEALAAGKTECDRLVASANARVAEAEKRLHDAETRAAAANERAEAARAEYVRLLAEQRRDAEQWEARTERDHAARVREWTERVAEWTNRCEELRTAATIATQSAAEREAELATLREQAVATQGLGAVEVQRMHDERASLLRKLEVAETAAAKAAAEAIDRREVEDLQRRFELAVHDVRELKSRNAELAEELARTRKTGGAKSPPASAPVVAAGQSLDWESQKRRLLEQLEAEGSEVDAARQADRLTIESTIRITDEVVAEKDREINELQRVLENQSNNLGGVAVGAAAIAQLLDQDELVVHERERLKELQDRMRESEVALSMERAKIARQQQEYEAKLLELESERNRRTGGATTSEDGRKTTSNWFARLGLGERKS